VTEVIYYVAASVDGFIATPDGGVEWLGAFENPEAYGYAEFLASIDALVMGRRTFDQMLTFGLWPYADRTSVVLTRRPFAGEVPPNVTISDDAPGVAVGKLAASGARRVWLVGGAELLRSFRAEGLVMEYYVSILPVFLGDGIPLFPTPGPAEPARLLESRAYPDGVLQVRWSVSPR
jgi:dihydrofolate reductase